MAYQHNFQRGFLACLLYSLLTSTAIAQEAVITKISVEGNQKVEIGTILLQVESAVGETISNAQIEKDIKNVFRTGYFEDVSVVRLGDELIFRVRERPAIRDVEIKGNDEVKKETVEEQLNLTARRFLDTRKIRLGIEELKKYYQEKGFYGTEVAFEVEEVGENQVDLTFDITEGEERVIREVSFEGNSAYSDKTLRKLVATARYKWWSSWITGNGVVKEENLERDVGLLTQHYLSTGYVDVKVSRARIEQIETGLRLVYQISEGEIFHYGKISASGDLIEESEEKTLDGVASKQGAVFDVNNLREDAFAISEKFTDIGYAFVNVNPSTDIDRVNKIVNLTFVIDKGNLITVRRVEITGNKKTRDNVIRRSLKISEQELFSSSKIKRSQELLQRLGYFDEVTITPSPTDDPDMVDLDVAVREGNTGTFSAGAGVSSGDGFIVTSRISENNLFGSGTSLSMDINTGNRNKNYVLSFDNPRMYDTRWSLGVDALSVERVFDDFDREQKGGSIRVGYPLWFLGPKYLDDVRFSLGYELVRISIDDVDKDAPQLVVDEQGDSTASSISPGIVRNTIDNPLDPTKGSRQNLKIEFAGIGGDQKFWLANVSNSVYYPLWKSPVGNFVFSNRIRFGWGDTFNGDTFPLFRRFFPGGINSVRGFDSRELGPKDAEGNEFGGSKQFVTNFEVIFPLVESFGLKGVAFYDMGQAFDDEESIDFGDLRHAVGWGIRWRSPIAPIRVEIGYPLDKEEGDKSVVTNFSFGAPL